MKSQNKNKTNGSKINKLIDSQGLTQEELARKSHLPCSTLTKNETNVISKSSIQTVIKIAKGYTIDGDDLKNYSIRTRSKIKIFDNTELRDKIFSLYEELPQILLAEWSLLMAKHVLFLAGIRYSKIPEITYGFKINKLWQKGNAKMHDVRQAGFAIHKVARECKSDIQKNALRTTGQAVASGHMKEHAMVASDYAIKTIGLISGNDAKAITSERLWQLNKLKKMSFKNKQIN